jgi:hypothetical protein
MNEEEIIARSLMIENINLIFKTLINTIETLKPVDERSHLIAKVNLDQALSAFRRAYLKQEEEEKNE